MVWSPAAAAHQRPQRRDALLPHHGCKEMLISNCHAILFSRLT